MEIIVITHVFLLDFITGVHYLMNKQNPVKRVSPHKENPIIAGLKLIFLTPIFIWAFTDWIDFANIALGKSIQWIGVGVLLLSLAIFIIAHIQLGRNWWYTPRIDEKHEFITKGLYKYIRHPMYTAGFIGFAAYFLVSENWLVGTIPVLCFYILYAVRVGKEEELMEEEFGKTYLDYRKNTPRLFPK